MSEVIHLKVKKASNTKEKSRNNNIDIANVFIESCEKLDASIFEPYVREEDIFEDLDKYRFLASLKENFDRVLRTGFKETKLIMGTCIGCQRGHHTHGFYTGKNTKEFAYIIMKDENGNLVDIFQCYLSLNQKVDEVFGQKLKEDDSQSNSDQIALIREKTPFFDLFKDVFDLEE